MKKTGSLIGEFAFKFFFGPTETRDVLLLANLFARGLDFPDGPCTIQPALAPSRVSY